MKTCETCKWREQEEALTARGYYKCLSLHSEGNPAFPDDDYAADPVFYVTLNFGCNQWESAKESNLC